MTTDNPRELRADAEMVRDGSRGKSCDRLADHILATVRDDDGEEQPDVTYELADGTDIEVSEAGVWAKSFTQFDVIHLLDKRPTRGQFRALCRGLGIEVPG